jgi:polar amino acid transport system substrate-binding protein
VILLAFACTKKEAPLTLLTEEYPPLTFQGKTGVTGFAVDVVQEIQKVLKTDYKPTLVDWDTAYQRALSEPNVVIFTIEKTAERDTLFNWIGPLGENITYLYAPKDTKLQLANIEDAQALKSIGTVTNWFSEQHLVKQGFTNLISSAKPAECLRMLMENKVEAAAFTDLTFGMIAQEAGFSPTDAKPLMELLRTEYYIAVSKGTDQKIVDKWSKAFQSLETSGTLDQLRNKWLTGREVSMTARSK